MMRPLFFAVALTAGLPLCAQLSAAVPVSAERAAEAAADADGWMVDFEAAQARAKALNRPLFLQFTGSDWCHWCQVMDEQVFTQAAWKTYAAESLVLVKADFPQGANRASVSPEQAGRNAALAKRFGIRGLPNYLIFAPDGTKIGRLRSSSGIDAEGFIGKVRAITEAGVPAEKPAAKPIAKPAEEPAVKPAAAVAATPTAASASAPTADADGWMLDFEAAQAKARELKRPLFLQFTGSDWCYWCKLMESKVFSQPGWKRFAAASLVTVKADFPRDAQRGRVSPAQAGRNAALAKRFDIHGFPKYLVFDAEGRRLGEMGAYRDIDDRTFIDRLTRLIREASPAAAPAEPAEEAEAKAAEAEADADGWIVDFAAAQAKARELKRPVFLQFTGSDWCGWCMMMDRQVFLTADWKAYAAKSLILAKADFPRKRTLSPAQAAKNAALRERFGIQGYPSYLLFDAEGRRIGRLGAIRDVTAAEFIGRVEAVIQRPAVPMTGER